jgi:hypothetical protein
MQQIPTTRRLALWLAALALAWHQPAAAETRVALVIGNGAYTHAPRLVNPGNDAELMAASLRRVGFAVIRIVDADQRAMKQAMLEFGRSLRSSDAVGLFYYAGHGVQVNGENYLIPVTANIREAAEVALEGVNVNEFLATMERAAARINIVILDACRDNPFAGGSRSAGRGLASVDAPRGTYIAFATSPNAVALDGEGADNSPYTAALARAIDTPGLTIEQVFKQTRVEVQKSTREQQTPWETSSITGEFFFVPGKAAAAASGTAPAAPAFPQPSTREVELAFWNSIKDSGNPGAYRSYLQQFPNGSFAPLARLRIEELQQPAPPPAPQAPPQTALVVPPPPPPSAGYQWLIAWSSQRTIDDATLRGLDCDQLWVARNEIFHRNGYCFQTARGKAYFDNSGCRTSNQNILSALERRNVDLIQAQERRRNCR